MPLTVRHNVERNRFEADVEGGLARCDYHRRGDVLYAHHTQVPEAAEGRGIAAAVVAALMDFAEQNALKVAPACSYVRHYMQRHPETRKLLPADQTL